MPENSQVEVRLVTQMHEAEVAGEEAEGTSEDYDGRGRDVACVKGINRQNQEETPNHAVDHAHDRHGSTNLLFMLCHHPRLILYINWRYPLYIGLNKNRLPFALILFILPLKINPLSSSSNTCDLFYPPYDHKTILRILRAKTSFIRSDIEQSQHSLGPSWFHLDLQIIVSPSTFKHELDQLVTLLNRNTLDLSVQLHQQVPLGNHSDNRFPLSHRCKHGEGYLDFSGFPELETPHHWLAILGPISQNNSLSRLGSPMRPNYWVPPSSPRHSRLRPSTMIAGPWFPKVRFRFWDETTVVSSCSSPGWRRVLVILAGLRFPIGYHIWLFINHKGRFFLWIP